MITSTTLNPKLIFIQASTPSDVTEGKLWYNTSNNKTYVSDGTSYNLVADVDLTSLIQTNLENSLDILEIQAADTLEGGQGANLIRDVFSDADGYLNTINTAATTATFSADKYQNSKDEAKLLTPQSTNNADFNFDVVAKVAGFMKLVRIAYTNNGALTARVTISQDGVQLAQKNGVHSSGAGWCDCVFEPSDYSAVINPTTAGGVFNIRIEKISSTNMETGLANTTTDYTGTFFDLDGVYTHGDNGNQCQLTYTALKTIVQTAKQDLPSTPTKAQIFAWKDATTGTGSINADVSFDNGAHYQTMALNTETTITDTGNKMILKINLNAGAPLGTAELKGYGVMFW